MKTVNTKTITIPGKLIKVVGIALVSGVVLFLTVWIVKEIIKKEAMMAKTEIVEKTVNFNDTAAAKAVATTIHKFSAFKDRVKKELRTLDSADKK